MSLRLLAVALFLVALSGCKSAGTPETQSDPDPKYNTDAVKNGLGWSHADSLGRYEDESSEDPRGED